MSLFVIAEAGVNHNGRLDLAIALVDAAAAAGADAVKFQTFRAESLAAPGAQKAEYQKRSGPDTDQLSMLRDLELDRVAHETLFAHCAKKGIEFMSTPFEVDSVAMLDRLGVRRFKVASGEINNPILLRRIAQTKKPMIISTGMSSLADVEYALGVVAGERRASSAEALWTGEGYESLASDLTLLHCTTEYPAPVSSVNLRAMVTLATAFQLPVGYSDHTNGFEIACAAVALGATVIEKHFTLDRSLPGPDHAASLEATQLAAFVGAVRNVEVALGNGRKVPAREEIPNRAIARRSIVAAAAISKGTRFSEANLTLKRPGTGIPASRIDEVIGRVASRDYKKDECIE